MCLKFTSSHFRGLIVPGWRPDKRGSCLSVTIPRCRFFFRDKLEAERSR